VNLQQYHFSAYGAYPEDHTLRTARFPVYGSVIVREIWDVILFHYCADLCRRRFFPGGGT
jgi:hypothetical protein